MNHEDRIQRLSSLSKLGDTDAAAELLRYHMRSNDVASARKVARILIGAGVPHRWLVGGRAWPLVHDQNIDHCESWADIIPRELEIVGVRVPLRWSSTGSSSQRLITLHMVKAAAHYIFGNAPTDDGDPLPRESANAALLIRCADYLIRSYPDKEISDSIRVAIKDANRKSSAFITLASIMFEGADAIFNNTIASALIDWAEDNSTHGPFDREAFNESINRMHAEILTAFYLGEI